MGIALGFRATKTRIDDFDRKIIGVVQENNQLTASEIGGLVGLSKSAVQRRLTALRSGGQIAADVAVPDPSRLGTYLTFILFVTLNKGRQPERMARLREAVLGLAEIQQCYHVTGATDFVMIVNVHDQGHFSELTRALLYENPDIARFETCLVVDRTKVTLSLPVAS